MPVALVQLDSVDSVDTGTAPPHARVTRADWIAAALSVLCRDGIDHVRIVGLAERLNVARSSFYWYFKSRETLLDSLLAVWADKNTQSLVAAAAQPSPSIGAAVLGVFACWAAPHQFEPQLDVAVRDWAKRDASVARLLADADATRLDALTEMYTQHGFGAEAVVRARVLYYTQIGYYALGVDEPAEVRAGLADDYVRVLTGSHAHPHDLQQFARALIRDRPSP